MKPRHALLASAIILLAAFNPCNAHAGGRYHGHWGGYPGGGFPLAPFAAGLIFGAALAPRYYEPVPPPKYYYPAPAYVPGYPVQPAPQVPAYWYYCASAQLYHPYVLDCPEGWQQIPRQPLF